MMKPHGTGLARRDSSVTTSTSFHAGSKEPLMRMSMREALAILGAWLRRLYARIRKG